MTLVAGPVDLTTPAGVDRVDVVTARDMAEAVDAALPADAAVMVAASSERIMGQVVLPTGWRVLGWAATAVMAMAALAMAVTTWV